MNFSNFGGKSAIGECELGVIVAQCRQFPIVLKTLFVDFDDVFFHEKKLFSDYKDNEIISCKQIIIFAHIG